MCGAWSVSSPMRLSSLRHRLETFGPCSCPILKILMTSQYRNLRQLTRRLIDEALSTVRKGFQVDADILRPLELVQLEQRVLMSASPVSAAAEVVVSIGAGGAAETIAEVAIEQTEDSPRLEANSVSETSRDSEAQSAVELVVIDPSANDYLRLVEDLQSQSNRTFEILVLDPREDGIAQITDALNDLNDVGAIHLVSHGDEGEILLGTSVLSQKSLHRYAAELVTWQHSLTDNVDLLIYGCDLAASSSGVELTESLNRLLGADVAASDDLTGHASHGGDWDLEVGVGVIETSVAFTEELQGQWQGLLTLNAYEAFDYAAGSLNGQNGGTGWATGWNLESGSSAVVRAGLTAPAGLPVGQGGTLEMNTTTIFEQSRDLATTLGTDGTTAWFSFLLKPDGTGSGGISLEIGDGSGADDTVNIGTNGNDFLVGINGSASGDTVDNVVVSGQTHFLVVQIDFAAGNDNVTLYVDPTAGVDAPDSPGALTAQLTTADLGTFTRLGVIGGFTGNNSNIDEIRVGTSFADVAGGSTISAPSAELWFTTRGSGNGGGTTWTNSEVIRFGNGGDTFDLDTGTSVGDYSKLDNFNAPADIRALHYVETSTRIGLSPNHFDLEAGDLVLTLNATVTLNSGGANQFDANRRDIVVFRPTSNTDYTESNGEWFMLLDDGIANATNTLNVHGLAVVEVNTTIGGSTLTAGTLLIAHSNPNHQDIATVRITGTGTNSAADIVQTFLSGADLGNAGDRIRGLHLLQQDTTFGTSVLEAGTLLVQVDNTVDFAGQRHRQTDVIALTVGKTEQETVPATLGSAVLLFDGSDISLNSANEHINGLTLVSTSAPTESNVTWFNEVSSAPAIDGAIDPVWTAEAANELTNVNVGSVDDTTDFSGHWKSVWDSTNLYFLIDVTDDSLVKDSAQNFQDDQVAIYIDADRSQGSTFDGVNDFEYAFRYDDPGVVHPGANSVNDTTGVSFNLLPSSTGYVLEVSVPWTTLGVTPENLDTLGIDVHVTDDDDGGNRDSKIAWNDSTDQAFSDPATFGTATLRALPNTAPMAVIGAVSAISEGNGLTLDASGSSDVGGNTLTYQWDLNYDGVTFDTDESGVAPSIDWATLNTHGVRDDGTYQVALRVNNGSANSLIAQQVLTVNNTAPGISVTGASETGSGEDYVLNLAAIDPGNDTIIGWTVNWGDGQIDSIVGNPSTATHTYTNDGITNNITVSAVDEDGIYLASRLYTTSHSSSQLFGSDGNTTTSNSTSTSPAAVVIGPDGFLYVANWGSDSIDRHDPVTGEFVNAFAFGGDGILDQPSRMAFGPNGDLYVTSMGNDRVIRYSGKDGRFLEAFLDATSGLNRPDGIAFGSDGFLYVANSATGEILKFNATTGVPAGVFVTFGVAGNIDLNFGANGSLFASSTTANVIREFDGVTGNIVADLVTAATGQVTTISGFTRGPDNRIYVADFAGDRVVQYESDGTYLGEYLPASTGLNQPVDLIFSASHQVRVSAKPVANVDTYTVTEGGTLTQNATTDWARAGWKLRQQIAFDNTGRPALNDFPVLIKLHATATDAINIDYARTQDHGEDIRFIDGDGRLLSHQVDSWDESGYSYVWVKVPMIDGASNADSITMYFDNPHAADGSSLSSAWNADDVAVLHLNGSGIDSSSADNDGAAVGVSTRNGLIGRAASFNGTTSSMNLGSDDSIDDIFSSGGTVSVWINASSWGENGYGRIADKASSTFSGGSNGDGWAFQTAGAGSSGQLIFEHGFSNAHGEWRTADGSLTLNTWHHVALVYNNSIDSNAPQIYIDGVLQTLSNTRTADGTARSDAALNLVLGNNGTAAARTFDGLMDEFRISNVASSAAEIEAQFASMNGTLAFMGSLQAGPGGVLQNDIETDGDDLTVTLKSGPAHSTSFSLQPNGSFTYVHDGTDTTSDMFEYFVTDGLTTHSTTVLLTITPENDAPTISAIANVTISEDSSTGPIDFVVGDSETANGALTVTATSSDQALIADGDITIGGSGLNRTISFVPVQNASGGPANITVTVSDGSKTSTTTFDVTILAQNDPPLVSTFSDLPLLEDTTSALITFTIGDRESAASDLTVTATSSDPALINNGGIEILGTDANRALRITPNLNASGATSTISVTISDGLDATTETFDVTVAPTNDAPTISSISDGSTQEDTPTPPISFTVGDIESPLSTLDITATSSDQTLFADSDLVFSGTGANRTIILTPRSNANGGPATITITVSDGVTSSSTTFEETVIATNDAPVISAIADQIVAQDGTTAPVGFAISDIDTAISALVVTATSDDQSLIQNTDIVLQGTGNNRFFQITPIADASGSTTITIMVSDGGATSTQKLNITVTPGNDSPILTPIADVLSDEDNDVGPIRFSVTDGNNTPAELIVTAISNDQSLISDSSISVLGAGENRRIRFTPEANAYGTATITVTVSDGTTSQQQTFIADIAPVNDAPEVAAGQVSKFAVPVNGEFVSAAGRLLLGATDVENDEMTVIATQPQNGTLVVKSDGTFVYKPFEGFSGTDTFNYVVSDGDRQSARNVVSLEVPIVAAPPVNNSGGEESSSESSSESETTTDETSNESDNGDDNGSESPPTPTAYDGQGDDEKNNMPPPTVTPEENESDVAFTVGEIANGGDEFLFQGQDVVEVAPGDRVQASMLRSLDHLNAVDGGDHATNLLANTNPTVSQVQFSYEKYAELKGTVEQIEEFEEQLESSSGVAKIAESVVIVGGTSLMIGSVITAVQSGMLALGFISQLPAWTLFDPLMFMDGVSGSDDGDSLQDIVDQQTASDSEIQSESK